MFQHLGSYRNCFERLTKQINKSKNFGILESSSLKWYSDLRASPQNVDIEIAIRRLGAIKLELEREISNTNGEEKEIALSKNARNSIDNFGNYVEKNIPPPISPLEDTLLGSDKFPYQPTSLATRVLFPESQAPSFRNLVEVEMQLRSEIASMKGFRFPVLSSRTMETVYKTIEDLERLTMIKAIQTKDYQPTRAFPSSDTLCKKINLEIIKEANKAKSEITSVKLFRRTEDSKRIALYFIDKMQKLYMDNRNELDSINMATLFQRLAQIGVLSGWLDAYINSRGLFLHKLVEHAAKMGADFDPKGAAYMLWAMGKFGKKFGLSGRGSAQKDTYKLLTQITNRIAMNINSMLPFEVVSSVRGLGHLEFSQSRQILIPVAERIRANPAQFLPNHLVWILWAFVKLKFQMHRELDIISESKAFSLSFLATSDVVLFLWILAKSRHHLSATYLPQISEMLLQRISEIDCLNAAKALFSFASYGYHPGTELLERLGSVMSERMNKGILDQEMVCAALVSLANLNYFPEDFATSARRQFLFTIDHDSLQHVCDALFCFSVLGKLDEEMLKRARVRFQRISQLPTDDRLMSRMAQVDMLVMHLHGGEGEENRSIFPEWISQKCNRAFLSWQEKREAFVEMTDVITTLKKMNFTIKTEYAIPEIPFLVTLVSAAPQDKEENKGDMYVVDAVGVTRMILGERPVIRSRCKWKELIITSKGYGMIRVEIGHWRTLVHDSQKMDYLREVTFPAGVIPSIGTKQYQITNQTRIENEQDDIVNYEYSESRVEQGRAMNIDQELLIEDEAKEISTGIGYDHSLQGDGDEEEMEYEPSLEEIDKELEDI